MLNRITRYLDDLFYLAGAGLICTGVYFVLPVATWFAAGAFCLHFSYMVGKSMRGVES